MSFAQHRLFTPLTVNALEDALRQVGFPIIVRWNGEGSYSVSFEARNIHSVRMNEFGIIRFRRQEE